MKTPKLYKAPNAVDQQQKNCLTPHNFDSLTNFNI